ncbi:hypothetical protein [Flavobacterium sp.]|uniref:hypothetical protein n=1 Tax=Flavobacterium sp. TaxID=239 RepID=UPI0026273D45|nr:hypothetical protein [Flavobacterium sp.]
MKKVLFFTFIVALGCGKGKSENPFESSLKDHIIKSADYPNSYEFISATVSDTLTESELSSNKLLKLEAENSDLRLKILDNELSIQENNLKSHPELFKDVNEGRQNTINSLKAILKANSSDSIRLSKITDNKNIVGFIIKHEYKIKNRNGDLEKKIDFGYFDKENKFLGSSNMLNYESFNLGKNR